MTTTQITKPVARKIRQQVAGQRRSISIGRSSNRAGAGTNTPIRIVDGDTPPMLVGQPYLKTQFSGKGGFSKTLYTPSTLAIEVGSDWIKSHI
jgi:hypothetical protein